MYIILKGGNLIFMCVGECVFVCVNW